jgi:hypothetical protein
LFLSPHAITIDDTAGGCLAEYWEITTTIRTEVNPATFFRALPKYFSDATTFVVGQTRKASKISEVIRINQAHEIGWGDISERLHAFFPYQLIYRFSPSLMEDLAQLLVRYSPVRLIDDTMYLLKGDTPLLIWYEALREGVGGSMFVTPDMPEDNLSAFVHELGLTEWERVTATIDPFEIPPKPKGMKEEVRIKLGCLIVVLLFLWLIVARGCGQ